MEAAILPGVWRLNLLKELADWVNPEGKPRSTIVVPNFKSVQLSRADNSPRIQSISSFESQGLPALDRIPISPQLVNNHPLREFIDKSRPLNSADYKKLLASPDIDLSISGYHGGAVAASVPSASTWLDPRRYDKNLWLRDWSLNFFAVHRSGSRALSHQMINAVFSFVGSDHHRDHVVGMHYEDTDPVSRFCKNERIPHTKFSIGDDGKIGWCKTPWAHQQIDGLTSSVNAVYRAANIEADQAVKIDGALRLDLRAVDPNPQHAEHILPAMIKALKGFKMWNASDVGPWEDFFAYQRATANGLGTSMTKEVIRFHERFGWNFLKVEYGRKDNWRCFEQDVRTIGRECKRVLDRRVPENGFAIECGKRPHDAALLLLLYPFKADLSANQEMSILRTVYANMGEVGFSRFLATLERDLDPNFKGHPSEIVGEPDLFVGQDYHLNTDPKAYGEFAKNCPGYKPAQWSLFDALLSGYFFRRYIESGGVDRESYLYGDRHLKRCLAFIVKEDCTLEIKGKSSEANKGIFSIQKGSLPEAMMWDSEKGEYRHNHNDLLMSRATLALAIERGIEAAKVWASSELANAA